MTEIQPDIPTGDRDTAFVKNMVHLDTPVNDRSISEGQRYIYTNQWATETHLDTPVNDGDTSGHTRE